MNRFGILFAIMFLSGVFVIAKSRTMESEMNIKKEIYHARKLKGPLSIDANWKKDAWKDVEIINVKRHMGEIPPFVPTVEAKMLYDQSNVYVIFHVRDRYVKSTVTEINGPVSENSCVEFFFAPDTANPLHYFNLEVNAGGTPLLFFITKPWSGYKELTKDEIRSIEIAHSLPSVVDPEIKEPVDWTIEYRIPLSLLEKYCAVAKPSAGVQWKANFYKTGSETSNPNYMTWSEVIHPKPNFHLPEYFGTIVFD